MDNLRIYGKAPYTIIVVHGGPGAGGEMAPVARELSNRWGVLEPIQTGVTLEEQVQELQNVIMKEGDCPVILVGYSWGAWLSFIVAAQYPAGIKKLVLVGCGPFEEKYAETIQTTRMSRLNETEKKEMDMLLALLNDPAADNQNHAFERFGVLFTKTDAYDPIEDDSTDTDETGFRLDIHRSVWPEGAQLRRSGELLNYASLISCPVVAIHGDYDPHPGEGVRKPLTDTVEQFRFIMLRNCGHKPWIERQARDNFYRILKSELG